MIEKTAFISVSDGDIGPHWPTVNHRAVTLRRPGVKESCYFLVSQQSVGKAGPEVRPSVSTVPVGRGLRSGLVPFLGGDIAVADKGPLTAK